MRWRESYERPEPIMTTGESRERVEVEARYELITPLGLREVAGVMGSPEFRGDKDLWNLDSEGLVGRALCDVYAFLSGEGYFHLARAAACLLEALALQDGAERVMPGYVGGSSGFESLPAAGMRAVAKAAAELAGAIGPYTRERVGYPASRLVGEAIGRIFTWLVVQEESWDASTHLGRAALDLMDAIHALKRWPELQAATLRGPSCEPPPSLLEKPIEGVMTLKWVPGEYRWEGK